jgi:glycosyltransferase involved in cell wall biosynthesis
MTTKPLVSAIIPTYNRAHIVCEAVESVFQQTYANIETIVVDDGSTDDTLARLRQYGGRVRVVTQANAGPAAARNRGIEIARGEFIAFLDSDDIWLPPKTERQVALLQRAGNSVSSCLSNIMMKWNSGDRASFDIACLYPSAEEGVWTNVDEVLATRFVLFDQGIMIRREVLEKIGGFDAAIRYHEDLEFPQRLSLEGPWAFIATPLVIWRESMTNSVYKNSIRDEVCAGECAVTVFEMHLARVQGAGSSARLRRLVSRELKKARRDLWLSRMRAKGGFETAVAHAAAIIERYRGAFYRRSPWYPRMKVVPLDRWAGAQVAHAASAAPQRAGA